MLFYLLDENSLDIIAAIDNYKSAIWTRRYYRSGDFELYVPATDEALQQLKQNRLLTRADDLTQAMIIERVQITTDAEQGNYITATGRSLSSILSRRIVWKQTTYNGNPEAIIRKLIKQSMIEPEIATRRIGMLQLGPELGMTGTMQIQYTGDNVETATQELCRTYRTGYDISLDLENKAFTFYLYRGADRSYNQIENPYVVFSNNFENLLSSEYTNDLTRYKNVAQIAGEGRGVARKKTTVGSASGMQRFETFVNASNISTNEGMIDPATYISLLARKGVETLAELQETESADGEVAANYTYKLGTDYFLGDVVEVVNEYGIALTPRVTEIIECQDDTGYSCIPTFAQDEEED